MTSTPIIETHNLSKSYGRTAAVRRLSMSIAPNRITAFLGLNGAGKSTTIKMLLGLISPTDGEGVVLGRRIDRPGESIDLRRHVAYVSEHHRLYGYMTVEEMIRFTRSFYPGWDSHLEQSLLRTYDLPPKRKVKALSKGMLRKLAMVLAFARRPQLIIMDEPGDGLDPVGVEQLLETMVVQCSEGASIFFSSHQIGEVERIADDVCMIHEGRLLMQSSLDDLSQSYRQIDLIFNSVPAEAEFQIPGVERIETRGHQMRVFASRNSELIVERAQSFYPNSIAVEPLALREIFLERVKGH